MAHYLVTGGCGFIGSHLVDELLAAGHKVRVLDNLSTGKRENLSKDADLMVGDITKRSDLRLSLKGIEGIFHLAAIASVQLSNEDWPGTHAANLSATISLYDEARTSPLKPPVVYASSAAVYGDNPNVPLSETAEKSPLTAYGADKYGCELHAKVAGAVHGLATCGLRFFNVYGPRQDPASPYSGVISIFARRIAEDQDITIHGDGAQVRDFVFVADVVAHLLAAMEAVNLDAPVYNVCTGKTTSIKALAQTLAELTGKPLKASYSAAREGDIRNSFGNPKRAQDSLKVKAQTDLRAGLDLLLKS